MSKLVVYVLDKIVWLLLIAAITTQSLQIVGVVEPPKTVLEQLSFNQEHEYTFDLLQPKGSGGSNEEFDRGKRQTTDAKDSSPFIERLFSIPSAAFRALNNFVQSSRPAFESFREFAKKRFLSSSGLTTEKKVRAVPNATLSSNQTIDVNKRP